MNPRQTELAKRRHKAHKIFAARIRRGDVIHGPSGPLEVEAGAVPVNGRIEILVIDYYPTGEQYRRWLRFDGTRELLTVRKEET